MDSVQEFGRAVRELISTPDRWCGIRGYALIDDRPVVSIANYADTYCFAGAIARIAWMYNLHNYPTTHRDSMVYQQVGMHLIGVALEFTQVVARKLSLDVNKHSWSAVQDWNDSERTHEEVMRVIDSVIGDASGASETRDFDSAAIRELIDEIDRKTSELEGLRSRLREIV